MHSSTVCRRIPNSGGNVVVNHDITTSTTWTPGNCYIITREVHVRQGAHLTILPGTCVLFAQFRHELTSTTSIPFATLVVDSGASINAEDVEFRSQQGGSNVTGGLILAGTLANQQFEDYPTVFSTTAVPSRTSRLVNVTFNQLGNQPADLNALTLLQVAPGEVILSNISINDAGDDALEIFGGTHTIDNLYINHPIADGIDLDGNATLTVTDSLFIQRTSVDSLGPGLIEVIGEPGTTNTLQVAEGANILILGRITDTTTGSITFTGSFAGITAGDPVYVLTDSALAGTAAIGINP